MRKKALTIALSDFEIGILILSFVAVLGWLYLVWKVSALVDNVSKAFETTLGSMGG